ncbi:hypothetical protein [Mycobacterium sp. IDR2000157661]|uniref:hypothetical protein n=1 Tax=Mycobacterium sp. IDR2000157661 TaxID=2867005 RepID=UPI001EE9EE8A|nr:hypothetical protein [Mycobacterium sp. IDR2000157661]ULE32584.1 hypothetical protein K3G64_21205 [Mycobacterium sp. IDR2000157661]
MTPRPVRADDALKYAAAILRSWTTDDDGAVPPPVNNVADLAALFGDTGRYSDGRRIESTADITPAGTGTVSHIWQPDPAAEQPISDGTALPDDPDGRSLGFFQVMTDPTTQTIRAYLVRPWS